MKIMNPDISSEHSVDENKSYNCNVCNKNFVSVSDLSKHACQNAKEKNLQCPTCHKSFTRTQALNNHTKFCTIDKNVCTLCNKQFADRTSYSVHMNCHTKKKTYVCKVCSKVFYRLTPYKEHLRIHSDEKTYACHLCPKKMKFKSGLREHIKRHSSERPFKCDKCTLSFYNRFELEHHQDAKHNFIIEANKHIKNYEESGRYDCGICQNLFSSSNQLIQHLPSHENEAYNMCLICQAEYVTTNKLIKHCLKHSFSEHFCTKCNKYFEDIGLAKHYENCHHLDCVLCGGSYQTRIKLKHHACPKKPAPYNCKFCTDPFHSKQVLKEHILTLHKSGIKIQQNKTSSLLKSTNKDLCKVFYNEKIDFNLQCRRHCKRNDKYKCGICKKEFSSNMQLNQHLPLHKDETVTSCFVCQADFSSINALIQHCLIHSNGECHLCKNCNTYFENKKALTIHNQARHTVICYLCNKSYSYSDEAKPHSCPELFCKKSASFCCKFCDDKFYDEKNLKEHILLLHSASTKAFQCEKCLRLFFLESHLRSHICEKSFTCDLCREIFYNKEIFLKHCIIHDQIKLTKCDACNNFLKASELNHHTCIGKSISKESHIHNSLINSNILELKTNSHCNDLYNLDRLNSMVPRIFPITNSEKRLDLNNYYHCDIVCDKTFASESNLVDHICSEVGKHSQSYTNQDFKKCTEIYKVINQSNDSLISINSPGPSKYKNVCVVEGEIRKKKLPSNNDLNNQHLLSQEMLVKHYIEHNQNQPMNLNVCNKNYSDNNELNHSTYVGKSMPYESISDQKNIVSSNENIVATNTNQQDSPYISDVMTNLKKTSINSELLLAVNLDKIKQEFNFGNQCHCNKCDKSFESEFKLIEHACTTFEKNLQPSNCEKIIFFEKNLLHSELNKKDSFVCVKCGQKFVNKWSYKQHMLVEHIEQPYKCEFCGKKFSYNSLYKSHLKTHN